MLVYNTEKDQWRVHSIQQSEIRASICLQCESSFSCLHHHRFFFLFNTVCLSSNTRELSIYINSWYFGQEQRGSRSSIVSTDLTPIGPLECWPSPPPHSSIEESSVEEPPSLYTLPIPYYDYDRVAISPYIQRDLFPIQLTLGERKTAVRAQSSLMSNSQHTVL